MQIKVNSELTAIRNKKNYHTGNIRNANKIASEQVFMWEK